MKRFLFIVVFTFALSIHVKAQVPADSCVVYEAWCYPKGKVIVSPCDSFMTMNRLTYNRLSVAFQKKVSSDKVYAGLIAEYDSLNRVMSVQLQSQQAAYDQLKNEFIGLTRKNEETLAGINGEVIALKSELQGARTEVTAVKKDLDSAKRKINGQIWISTGVSALAVILAVVLVAK